MRLFIAVQLSDEMKKSIVGSMHDLKLGGIKGKYTPAQNLHLTMCFIGEIRDAGAVMQALSAVRYRPFRLAVSDTGNFGDTLWLGIRGGQAVNRLAADIRSALTEAGIAFDTKKFTPHITLVRRMSGSMPKISVPKTDMMVRKVSLMKSEQKNGKTEYTEIFSF